jgi:hypothetical protein
LDVCYLVREAARCIRLTEIRTPELQVTRRRLHEFVTGIKLSGIRKAVPRNFRKKLKEAPSFKIQLLSNTTKLNTMSPPRDKVLVVIGCSPGISVATAALFAAHSFNKIALIVRNAQRLEDYRATVLNTAKLAHVKCWDVDVTQSAALNAVLLDVERMGQISCVFFNLNAARISPREFFWLWGRGID